jgi:molecular chaperone HtpG
MDTVEKVRFQADTKRLLDLMIHSLYTSREIFLRELISNASDALDRLRFEALTNPDLLGDDPRLEIRLNADPSARTLVVQDTGIGMSREEVIANIGTIARSGTREVLDRIKQEGTTAEALDMIGRFGVGFYSAFMVADKVTLVTRRAGETISTRWESTGDGHYMLSETSKPTRGTAITLHLKPADADTGLEDFTESWVLRRIIKRYSDFVSYPIIHKETREETEKDEIGIPKPNGQKTIVTEENTLNSMKPLWTRPRSNVTQDEYNDFYAYISNDWNAKPFETLSLRAEGRSEFQALLFIPSEAPHDLYYHGAAFGLQLYAQRVMIMERCEDMLPRYLRFIKGVVDSSDLPLNISRQRLQQDQHVTRIRQWLTKRVLETLHGMHAHDPENYVKFWQQFGRSLKEGVSSDYENRETIVSLLLFKSSYDPENLTTLKDYVSRMPLEQTDIFYLIGTSRRAVENSPHLEALKVKGYEVLYLLEPVDELVVQHLTDFQGKRLKSVGKGTVRLGNEEEKKQAEEALKKTSETFAPLLELLEQKLEKYVKEVRLSSRLTASPVCLVGADLDFSPQMERLLNQGNGHRQRRIMEINPTHPILFRLYGRFQNDKDDPLIGDYAELLFGYGLLAEGSELSDPIAFNQQLSKLMLDHL